MTHKITRRGFEKVLLGASATALTGCNRENKTVVIVPPADEGWTVPERFGTNEIVIVKPGFGNVYTLKGRTDVLVHAAVANQCDVSWVGGEHPSLHFQPKNDEKASGGNIFLSGNLRSISIMDDNGMVKYLLNGTATSDKGFWERKIEKLKTLEPIATKGFLSNDEMERVRLKREKSGPPYEEIKRSGAGVSH